MDFEEIYAKIKYDQMGLCEFESWYQQLHSESFAEGHDTGYEKGYNDAMNYVERNA